MGPITVIRTKHGPDVVMTATRYPLSSNNIIIAGGCFAVVVELLGIVSPSVSFSSLSSLSVPDMNRTGENRLTVLLRDRIHQANLNMDLILSYRRFVQLFCSLPPIFLPVALLSSPFFLYVRFSSFRRCARYFSPLRVIFCVHFEAYISCLPKQSFSW